MGITVPQVIGLFQLENRADRCLTELELNGFTPVEVSVVQFHSDPPKRPGGILNWMASGGIFGDTVDQSDGVSVMDGMTVGGSIGGLWGLAWGSRLPWGPVIVGFAGILLGGLAGLLVDRLVPEKRRALYRTKRLRGLIQVSVTTADPGRSRLAEQILRRNDADQLAIVPEPPPAPGMTVS